VFGGLEFKPTARREPIESLKLKRVWAAAMDWMRAYHAELASSWGVIYASQNVGRQVLRRPAGSALTTSSVNQTNNDVIKLSNQLAHPH
jgi:hypothetical protein